MKSWRRVAPALEELEPRVLLSTVSSVAGQLLDAQPLDLAPAASALVERQADPDAGGDLYQLTAPARGFLTIALKGDDGLDAYLQIFNSAGRCILRNDNAARGTLDSRLRLYAAEDQTFYVLASDKYDRPGDYALTVASEPLDDCGNDPAAARKLRLNALGGGLAVGTVNYRGDEDVFTFTATKTGVLWVEVSGYGRAGLPAASVTAYAADGTVLGSHETAGAEPGSALQLDVTAGRTYFVRAGGEADGRGLYLMRLRTVLDYGSAEGLPIQPAGDTAVAGAIGADGRGSLYAVTAPANGLLVLALHADGANGDAYLEVYDGNDRRIALNDNASRATRDSLVRLVQREGQTYYVLAGDKAGTPGPYTLTVTSKPWDDCGNDPAAARAVRLSAAGAAAAWGTINYAQDTDVFSLVAARTGLLTVELSPLGRGNLLDGDLTASDADSGVLAADAAAGPGAAATVTFDVVRGQTYYVEARSHDGRRGIYRLAIRTDEHPAPEPPSDAPSPGPVITTQVRTLESGLQLLVIGTDGADTITVSQSAAWMTVTTPSWTHEVDGRFASLIVYGFGGDDVLRTAWTVTAATWIYGGEGDDRLFEAGAEAVLDGGDGRDLLVSVGGGGGDQLVGGGGLDRFWFDGADTVADPSADETAATALHRISQFYQPYTTNPAHPDYVPLEVAGQDLADPALTTAAARYRNFSTVPVFADGPQYRDVAQGSVGDCYFLAALASLADTDPALIEEMLAPLGDGTYAVRFYRGGQAQYLRVDGDLPVRASGSLAYARLGPDNELWVPLAEKAYAYFRRGQNSYASIEAGWMSSVYTEVTNRSAGTVRISGASAGATIESQLDAGHAVTLASKTTAGPVVGGHAYMVKSVETGGSGTFVTVYNPWGYDGRPWDACPSDGLLRISADLLPEFFSDLVACTA